MLTSPSNSESRSFGSANPAAVQRKKRNLPGNPDPDAEVIALSPKSLLATNRFLCEICNKGFQRDQNLQLHRRGHNLPWKLKQRTTKEARKRVYICPEPSCVHHDPSRALGDLTGIKKHFSRKHGEKKWKCDKCSKKYAVQSDWKAHAKICGMREYRCDCGTIFSRRDSFITHRAFCDSLAEESARVATATPMKTLLQVKPATSSSTALCPTSSNLPTRASPTPLQTQSPFELQSSMDFKREDSFSMSSVVGMPLWLKAPTTTMNQMERFMPSFEFANSIHPTQEPIVRSDFSSTSSAPMSATALLQKAAEMGATVSKPSSTATASNSHGLELGSLKDQGSHVDHHEAQSLQDIMSSLPGPAFGSFEEAFSGFLSSRSDGKDRREDELTRDFLGVGGLSGFRDLAHRDLLSMSCIDHSVSNPCFDESSGNGNDLRSENSFNADQFINPKPW